MSFRVGPSKIETEDILIEPSDNSGVIITNKNSATSLELAGGDDPSQVEELIVGNLYGVGVSAAYFDTLQEAVAYASSQEIPRVCVPAGEYGGVDLEDEESGITLVGASPQKTTITSDDHTIQLGDGCAIKNLYVESTGGDAVQLRGDNAYVENCTMRTVDDGRWGISVTNSAKEPRVVRSIFPPSESTELRVNDNIDEIWLNGNWVFGSISISSDTTAKPDPVEDFNFELSSDDWSGQGV